MFGASGHGKVVLDILQRAGAEVAGFIDDAPRPLVAGLPVVPGEPWPNADTVALGIGANAARERVAARCRARGAELVLAIHPSACVAPSAHLGAGTVVMALVAINPDARIGEGVIVNTGAVVEHDVVLGDYCHLSPNVALAGAARVGARSHIGIGAVVLPGITVGKDVTVGAGAVVNRDLPDGVVAVGVPARILRKADPR